MLLTVTITIKKTMAEKRKHRQGGDRTSRTIHNFEKYNEAVNEA
jgi:hypothetical protein